VAAPRFALEKVTSNPLISPRTPLSPTLKTRATARLSRHFALKKPHARHTNLQQQKIQIGKLYIPSRHNPTLKISHLKLSPENFQEKREKSFFKKVFSIALPAIKTFHT
jgi:hypothetical protein